MATLTENVQRLAQQAERGARLAARTFYRELRRAGFADRHIMAVADELLGCLAASLRAARGGDGLPGPAAGEPALAAAPPGPSAPRSPA